MLSKSNGFILLPLLISLQLIFLLGLANLSSGLQILSHAELLNQKTAENWQIQFILHKVLSEIQSKESNCKIEITPAVILMRNRLLWWESHSCSGIFAGIRYYYAVEELGSDPCAIMNRNHVQTVIARYKRVSLLFLFDKRRSKSIWQASLAVPENHSQVCQGQKHHIVAGLQMLRELIQ